MASRRFVIWLSLLLICNMAAAQSPYMWHLGTDDGLETEAVYDVVFDQNGKAWLGTFGGLLSYNGLLATNHSTRNAGNRTATHLQFDEKGNIYYTNFSNGIYQFNIQNDSTIFVDNNPIFNAALGDFILDKQGFFWLGNANGVFKAVIKDNQFEILDSFKRSFYTKMLLDQNNHVWVGHYNLKNGQTILLNVSTKQKWAIPNSQGEIIEIFAINGNKLWFKQGQTQTQTFMQFNLQNGQIDTLVFNQELEPIRVNHFLKDEATLWFATNNGLFVVDENGQTLPFVPFPLFKNEVVSKTIKDFEGNTWVSTTDNGIFIIPNLHIVDLRTHSAAFGSQALKVIASKNKDWFIASKDNLVYHLDQHLNVIQSYRTKQNEAIQSIKVLNNQLWVGGHLGIEHFALGSAQTLSSSKQLWNDLPGVKDFYIHQNALYVSSWSDVKQLKLNHAPYLNSDNLAHFAQNSKIPDGINRLVQKRSNLVFFDSTANNLWVSTSDGPWLYHAQQKAAQRLIDKNGEPITTVITKILHGENGELWMATNGHGLLRVKGNELLVQYKLKEGLRDMIILDMAGYQNEIWLATYAGLQQFNTETEQFTSYQNWQGIETLPYKSIAVNSQYLMLAHKKASLLINKNTIRKEGVKPPILIAAVKINQRDTTSQNNYLLSYAQNNVSISLETVHFSSAKTYAFEYSLSQEKDMWNLVPAETKEINFYDLTPGNYLFKARAINSAGLKSDGTKSIAFTIQAPYWQTLWFQIVVALLITAVISIIAITRIRNLKNQAQLFKAKTAIENEKTRLEIDLRQAQLSAIKSQLNPHFIFNALNSIQEFILLNDRTQANRFLGKFADLMRFTLDNSNNKSITLADEIKMLNLYLELEGLRFEDHFSYHIVLAPNLNPEVIEIPSMLIQPYAENAIKHGLLHKKENKKLQINFELETGNVLCVCIEDNGIGRQNASAINKMRNQKHQSFASNANKQRLKLINNNENTVYLKIEDLYEESKAIGTRVTIRIQL